MSPEDRVLRVLAIDDDLLSLKVLSTKLQLCGYKATKATEALAILRENKDDFDIVLTDIMMPDMDGITLLEIVRFEIDTPVILISSDSDFKAVVKGMKSGAQDYFAKPVEMENLRKLPGYAYKKPGTSSGNSREDEVTKMYDTGSHQNASCRKKHKNMRERISWTQDLREKFINVVQQLEAEGTNRVIPTKILELMNDSRLSRGNVASHLQKYRKGLTKKKESNKDERSASTASNQSHVSFNCSYSNERYDTFTGSGRMSNGFKHLFPRTGMNTNMLPQNYLRSSQMHPESVSGPLLRNVSGEPGRNSIQFDNSYQTPGVFGSNLLHRPSYGSSFEHEIPPYRQCLDAFAPNFQIHRGNALPAQMAVLPQIVPPFQQVQCSLPGNNNARSVNCNVKGNLNLTAENNGYIQEIGSRPIDLDGNEQARLAGNVQNVPERHGHGRRNSFGLDDELRALIGYDTAPTV